MDYYGTLGPACAEEDILFSMYKEGMTGLRLNLSHGLLADRADWIRNGRNDAARCGIPWNLLIDLQGPELRIGDLENREIFLATGSAAVLGIHGTIPVPAMVIDAIEAGDHILLDDGKIELRADHETMTGVACSILRGGRLTSRKSIFLVGKSTVGPTLTRADQINLDHAREYGVRGVMLPFVRNCEDLRCLKEALQERGLSHIRVFAKIENMDGVHHLEEFLTEADEIVIARGDLGNAMPLWELPGVQKQIEKKCIANKIPFMVVTQMLDSMCDRPVPTRAEVMDIYQAVLDGASSVMVTGETAAGAYPVDVIRYLVNTGRCGLRDRKLR